MTIAHLFTVDAEADPQLPARILGLFTQRGLLPDWFSARSARGATLRIVVEIAGLDDATCALLARKLLNLPTVLDVALRRVGPRAALVA
jgi:hypothetical protein